MNNEYSMNTDHPHCTRTRTRDFRAPCALNVDRSGSPLGRTAPLQAFPSLCIAQTQRTACTEPMRLDRVALIWPDYNIYQSRRFGCWTRGLSESAPF